MVGDQVVKDADISIEANGPSEYFDAAMRSTNLSMGCSFQSWSVMRSR